MHVTSTSVEVNNPAPFSSSDKRNEVYKDSTFSILGGFVTFIAVYFLKLFQTA
jgi:hypothetical protein